MVRRFAGQLESFGQLLVKIVVQVERVVGVGLVIGQIVRLGLLEYSARAVVGSGVLLVAFVHEEFASEQLLQIELLVLQARHRLRPLDGLLGSDEVDVFVVHERFVDELDEAVQVVVVLDVHGYSSGLGLLVANVGHTVHLCDRFELLEPSGAEMEHYGRSVVVVGAQEVVAKKPVHTLHSSIVLAMAFP